MQAQSTDINSVQIHPLSDRSLLVHFGNSISPGINDRVLFLHNILKSHAFEGFIESVPAYASMAVFYDTFKIRMAGISSAYEFAKKKVEELLKMQHDLIMPLNEVINIPVYYGGENGPDISIVAALHQLTTEEVIRLHCSTIYRVYMIGFTPGFAYMGPVDKRIVTPRKDKPRILVPAGSVGIAGEQTGVYPMDSPGGWQIIGRTSRSLFDKNSSTPCLLKAGDRVQFVATTKE